MFISLDVKKMKPGLIITATCLFLIGLGMIAVRIFLSNTIPDFGLGKNIDIVCIFIPAICIVFGIVLFILGIKAMDLRIQQEPVIQKYDSTNDALKTLDARFAKGEITKEQYNEMKRELKK